MSPWTQSLGGNKKKRTYYNRIWAAYAERKPDDCVTRPLTSVQTRLKMMWKKTVRCVACFKNIVGMRKSGKTEHENSPIATAIFNRLTAAHPREDAEKKFQFHKCWELLRGMPKFQSTAHCGSSGGGSSSRRGWLSGESATKGSPAQGSELSSRTVSRGRSRGSRSQMTVTKPKKRSLLKTCMRRG